MDALPVSTTEQVGSVAAGRYLIEVGGNAGLALERRAAEADDARVADALARRDDPPAPAGDAPPAPAGDGPLDAASEATARCEEAADLFGAIVRGELLDLEQLGGRLDVMLELVQRLDRDGEHEHALRVARSVTKLMTLLARWRQLARTLGVALHAARELGDEAGIAWAEHDLGTLELVAGRMRQAEEHLDAARTLRLRLGDRRALALTERNLHALCGRLRELARDGALEGRRRPPRLVLALLAALLLLLGGVAGSMAADEDPPASAATPAPTAGPTASATATPVADVTLDVRLEGNGRVTGPEVDCGDDCRARRPAGSTAKLRDEPDPGWRFVEWRGVACDAPACAVELGQDVTVTAVFAADVAPTPTPRVPVPTPPVPSPDPSPGPTPDPSLPPDPTLPPDESPSPEPIPGPIPIPILPEAGTVPASE